MRHTDNVRNSAQSCDDATQCIGIFFTELLEQYQTKLAEKLIFAALLDDNS